MKNAFKVAALALIVSVSVSACGGGKKANGGDTSKVDSAKTITDTLKNDTTIKTDSSKKDTIKKDTTVKTVVKKTETIKK